MRVVLQFLGLFFLQERHSGQDVFFGAVEDCNTERGKFVVEFVDDFDFIRLGGLVVFLHEQHFALFVRLGLVVQHEAPVHALVLAQLEFVGLCDEFVAQPGLDHLHFAFGFRLACIPFLNSLKIRINFLSHIVLRILCFLFLGFYFYFYFFYFFFIIVCVIFNFLDDFLFIQVSLFVKII